LLWNLVLNFFHVFPFSKVNECLGKKAISFWKLDFLYNCDSSILMVMWFPIIFITYVLMDVWIWAGNFVFIATSGYDPLFSLGLQVERIDEIGLALGISEDKLQITREAATFSMSNLSTVVVTEFASLSRIMARHYALREGYSQQFLYVAHAFLVLYFSMLMVTTCGASYVIGSDSTVDLAGLRYTCTGTMMVAASRTLNQASVCMLGASLVIVGHPCDHNQLSIVAIRVPVVGLDVPYPNYLNASRYIKFQVRGELEHLLDDNKDMTRLCLTRKWLQNQQSEALFGGVGSVSFTNGEHHLR
ncbi:glycine--tRNA ligase, chloroplastic/mitochondrial 2 isoform X2, partial [Tanacetum coccineum]